MTKSKYNQIIDSDTNFSGILERAKEQTISKDEGKPIINIIEASRSAKPNAPNVMRLSDKVKKSIKVEDNFTNNSNMQNFFEKGGQQMVGDIDKLSKISLEYRKGTKSNGKKRR